MNFLDELCENAKRAKTRIALSEGEDPRIAQGAVRAQMEGLCDPVLIGNEDAIADLLRSYNAKPEEFEIIDS